MLIGLLFYALLSFFSCDVNSPLVSENTAFCNICDKDNLPLQHIPLREVEREVLIPSPWASVTGCMGMVQNCIRGGLDWTLASISLPRGWQNTGTGFPEG